MNAKNRNGSVRIYSEGKDDANISESHFEPRRNKILMKMEKT